MLSFNKFRKVHSILGVTAIDSSADSISVGGRDITFQRISGNIWVRPEATAVADTTAFLLDDNASIIDFGGVTTLSVISDGSGGTYQYIIYKEPQE